MREGGREGETVFESRQCRLSLRIVRSLSDGPTHESCQSDGRPGAKARAPEPSPGGHRDDPWPPPLMLAAAFAAASAGPGSAARGGGPAAPAESPRPSPSFQCLRVEDRCRGSEIRRIWTSM